MRRPGRRTNLGLGLALVAAGLTGGLAFALGTSPGRSAAIAHGMAGLAVLLLAPWKGSIIRSGWPRRRPGRPASALLILLATLCVATGVAHSTGLAVSLGPVSAMQVHVTTALGALFLTAAHVRRRPVRPRPADLERRSLLRAGALAAGAVIAYAVTEGTARAAGLVGADRRFTGSHDRGSHEPAAMPVTQWLDDRVPVIDGATWQVRVVTPTGDKAYRLEDLTEPEPVTAILDCTGGWYAEQVWTGVPLARLVAPGSFRSVVARSVTGYSRRFPVHDLHRLWLATGVGGEPLTPGHGAPARLIAPGRRGFWWVKWVVELRTSDLPWWVQSPFPLN